MEVQVVKGLWSTQSQNLHGKFHSHAKNWTITTVFWANPVPHVPFFPKHPPMSSTFEPIAHNIVLAQKLCLGTTAGTTVLCVQYPARVANRAGESNCTHTIEAGRAALSREGRRTAPYRTGRTTVPLLGGCAKGGNFGRATQRRGFNC
jgi:hypothetical protein